MDVCAEYLLNTLEDCLESSDSPTMVFFAPRSLPYPGEQVQHRLGLLRWNRITNEYIF